MGEGWTQTRITLITPFIALVYNLHEISPSTQKSQRDSGAMPTGTHEYKQSKQIYLENTSNRMGILKVIFVLVIGEHVDKTRKEKKPENKPPEFPRKGSASVETVSFSLPCIRKRCYTRTKSLTKPQTRILLLHTSSFMKAAFRLRGERCNGIQAFDFCSFPESQWRPLCGACPQQ